MIEQDPNVEKPKMRIHRKDYEIALKKVAKLESYKKTIQWWEKAIEKEDPHRTKNIISINFSEDGQVKTCECGSVKNGAEEDRAQLENGA